MKQIVQNMKSGETQIVEVPKPVIKPGHILVRTHASLVSSGTERMLINFAQRNLIGKAQSRPDLMRQVIQKASRDGILPTLKSAINRLDQPITLGYSSAGIVEEIAADVNQFKPGDRVVCAGGGYAVHGGYGLVPANLASPLPEEVDFKSGAFATISAIGLNGIRLADAQVGEKSAVIGMGLLGILTAKLLHASGCSVVGVEINSKRIKHAKQLRIDTFSPAEIQKNISALTRGRGFDHVFICADTQSNETVQLAGEIARDRAKIVAIGAVGMDIPRKIYYEKELVFMVSRSYGPGRYDPSYEEHGHDYPEGYVRWTEGRNLEAVTDLIASGKLDVEPLITHTFPIDQALDAYAMINEDGRDDYLGIIITYPETDQVKKITVSPTHGSQTTGALNIGVLGAGNYANAFFIPIISKNGDCQIHTIVSGRGLNAQQSAKRFGAKAVASDEDAVFENSDIDAVAILSRHNLHADQVIKALRSGKHIYCEKPLALSKDDTARIAAQLNKDGHPYLTVGFNRRFAPYSIKLKSFFEDRTEPVVVNYRVNAGFIPPTHWLHDTTIGGGRLIGEACHFIDYVLFLTDSIPVSINTVMMANANRYNNDNLVISIEMEDGSIASITYAANGSRQQGKEYIEVFCQGKSGVIDNFRSITLFDGKKHRARTFFSQDKGHKQSWKSFVDTIKSNGSPPVAYPQLLYSTYAALAAEESRRTRTAIAIEEFIHNK